MTIELPQHLVKRHSITDKDPAIVENLGWHITDFSIESIWKKGLKGSGVKIAILDSGIVHEHEDFDYNKIQEIDFTRSKYGALDTHPDRHGSHVAGIIAAQRNGVGIAGISPESDLFIGKVIGDNHLTDISALEYALYHSIYVWDVDIINCSVLFRNCNDKIHKLIKEAALLNKVVICASGNRSASALGQTDYIGTLDYPAAYQETIAVGAINENKRLYGGNSKGTLIDFVAPGEKIKSIGNQPNHYHTLNGSSFAAPFVSGVLSLMWPTITQKSLNITEIKELIAVSAEKFKGQNDRIKYGYGLIQPLKFYEELINY